MYAHLTPTTKVSRLFSDRQNETKVDQFYTITWLFLYLDESSEELLNLDGDHADEDDCLAGAGEPRGFTAGRTDCCLPFETT